MVLLAIITDAYPNGEALIDPANDRCDLSTLNGFLDQRIKRLLSLDADLGIRRPTCRIGQNMA